MDHGDSSMTSAPHHVADSEKAGDKNCPCCDGCAESCAAASGSVIAVPSILSTLTAWSSNKHRVSVDTIPASPGVDLLYRPPISPLL